MLAAESQSELDMRGLFHARRGQELVGAAWGQVIPGRTAFCWPACLVPWEPDETALPLQVAVDDYLDRASVTVVQAVLPVRAVTDANRLVRAGYQYLAELNYLVCFRDHFPLEKPNCGLNFEPGSPSQTTRLEKLVERTYVDSLECVGLDGMRPIGESWLAIVQQGVTALNGGSLQHTRGRTLVACCWRTIRSKNSVS